ncbi:prolyl oligopeptidase family serine peptidase [Caulobacter sp. SLTY]|uniref:prolyl oligopeptidase family serine peptidase n=1 Tax=Caulobacter sp. SLTY TaxID=2683262 RepID=UPI001412058E|nr:prolyl oligopeptidase family serine peptidase [Caulobacter sp. SLTY]NBB14561.1 prolyl oligopeptidase family serine peptidase [Caulobacter sp. SLTY]
MIIRLVLSALLALSLAAPVWAQEAYRLPPAPITQIIDAEPTPGISLSRDRKVMAVIGRENLPSIAAVSEPILRLAGTRLNPRTNGPTEARTAYLRSLEFVTVGGGARVKAKLPEGMRFFGLSWSPDGRRVALVGEAAEGLELWVVEVATGRANRASPARLNGTFGTPYSWLPDSSGFLVRLTVADRGPPPAAPAAPSGPLVQESRGRAAPVRTAQDLLASPHDEALFDHYFTSRLARVGLGGGAITYIGEPGIISGASVSPDGRYILTTRLKRPYSYIVPAGRFPTEIAVIDWSGRKVKAVVDRPLADNLPPPFDAVVTGPRAVSWRDDAPATLVWAEAQDGGDPRTKVEIHDRVLMQAAPFTAQPTVLADLKERYSGVEWGRADFALVRSAWFDTRHETWLAVNPARPGATRVLVSRNYQGRYDDPGTVLSRTLPNGRSVIRFSADGRSMLLAGQGDTAEGSFPFLAEMSITDGKSRRLWTSGKDDYEAVVDVADDRAQSLITRRENRQTPPNYVLRSLKGGKPVLLTDFPDPAPQFAGVTKQEVKYKRADGVQLSGTLYLPAGYDAKRDGPLPMLMWAYPAEFTDAAVAGQTVDRSNRFVRPGGTSHLFLLTQGYAIFDNPSMPIVGVKGAEPNDTYVEQLTANAEAAVKAVVDLGVADRDRIAIGGHSYGAFMTANLLAHTDLFRAGIARSGAYNRTLTPFGFQSEQRTYWEATDTYTKMSPFTYAPQIKEPILLIHGGADDNSGTFPVQTERFFAALKGAGATARYVVLPNEAHGYRARESTLHTLWEMTDWMDRYVKAAGPRK